MAEKIISPGVFTNEIDASFLPAAIGEIGAAVVGPTIKGPALIPTVISSMSEFEAKFGTSFKSGSNTFQYLTSHIAESYLKHANKITVVRILDGSYGSATATVHTGSGNYFTGSRIQGPPDDSNARSFTLNTIAHGALLNNSGSVGSNNTLLSGSKDSVRWEISTNNPDKGTFSLLIRRGNDTTKRKQVIETWNNLSLDPNSTNYVSKVIGDQYQTFAGSADDAYLSYNGSYPNKSKYVYVSNINDTIDYLDENGNIRDNDATGFNHPSCSIPGLGSGSFYGSFSGGTNGIAGFDSLGNIATSSADGIKTSYSFYDKISSTDSQGFALSSTTVDDGGTSYMEALALLSNQDEYDINLLFIPGIIDSFGGAHTGIITKAVDICEERGDCFLVYDSVGYDTTNIATVTTQVETRDSNYAASYWPWVQINDSQTGKFRWVPPSVELAGIFAFNDKVSHPWFAPAGLNRGGLDTVVQAARKLTQKNRDDLYESNVNPIATFPGQGVVVFGQKTLQKKASSLDRINVRRLLIKVKKFIAASSRFLVFEQNTASTRQRFLNIANPFLEQVQSQSGLNAFKVVMDETNNTPDVVDRNILYGQLFLQPTKTAEFIVLDFTIQATGATFPE
tara:strand:+ start:1364 stop:3229 length:1866 start_codon:yes stop_codon:yes gene_type:complete